METQYNQVLDSPSKNSYIGSYYQPPDRHLPIARPLERPSHLSLSLDLQMDSPRVSQGKPNMDSRGVVDALKVLQQKIRKLELERKQAETSYKRLSHDAQNHPKDTLPQTQPCQSAAGLPETDNTRRKELASDVQSAEARCLVLEKQLDYMRKLVENAKKEMTTLMGNQASLQNEQTSSLNIQSQREKLEKLESDCLNLNRTQTLAERKLAFLEQKLLAEEYERKLVQEKADKLQMELDVNLGLSVPATEGLKPNKKTKKNKKTSTHTERASPSGPRLKNMPFVAGTSTSPSHSVHANVQSILHMMKHHQPQLCERVSSLHRSSCAAKKSLQKNFPPSSTSFHKPIQSDQSLGSLSDLLLALQDELGQMSFEHQELLGQIDATEHQEQQHDLKKELERLVVRMEEKSVQITKLRKHQQTVHKLSQSQHCTEEYTARKSSGIKPPVPSLVKAQQKGKKGGMAPNNLQLLRETQKFRNRLRQDDISWET